MNGCTSGLSDQEGPANDDSKRGEPPRKISIAINGQSSTFPPGLDENNNPYLDYIEKNTNLDIQVMLPPANGYVDKLNVIMASGQLPDMINTGSAAFLSTYVKQGALKPLNEYIDKYGPDLKRLIPQEAWDQVTMNGNIYAIPSLNEVMGTQIMYVRKDWLDRLGLKPPRTLDEYKEVMRAFAKNDPDGNGKDDTIGFSITDQLGRTAPIFGAFGTQQNSWYERNGKLVYSATLPETKEALAFLAELYRDHILDRDFPLNKAENLGDKVASGKVGLYSAAWFDTRGPIELSRRNDPKANWIPLEYPTGKDGQKGTYSISSVRSYNVVPATSERTEEVVKLLNFIGGQGNQTLKLGFENEVWSIQDGKMVADFEAHNKHLYRGIYSSLCDTVVPEVTKRRLDSLGEHFHLWDNVQRIHANLIKAQFNGAPTPAMGNYNFKLLKIQDDAFTKIVMGLSPLDEFDRFVEVWRQEGGDEITKEINDWYKADHR
ncbi:extracellular solute-binding protein [Paenibacillus mesophilus]|nr:extracellular solute-binding protein [Paenibacillus mesophilus]